MLLYKSLGLLLPAAAPTAVLAFITLVHSESHLVLSVPTADYRVPGGRDQISAEITFKSVLITYLLCDLRPIYLTSLSLHLFPHL